MKQRMKRPTKRTVAVLAGAVVLTATGCSGTKERSEPNRQDGSGAAATAAGQAIPPRVAGAEAVAVDSTPEPAEDPRYVVGALAVPSTVERGSTATLTFRTRPGSSCQVEMRASSTNGTGGQRLPAAVANDAGLVSWSWNVSSNAPPGPATAYVVCSGGQRGQADLRIS
ncbi:MAG TPA: hypothetical protein VG795_11115 [Acidimicrobiia bacterium]|nr:hypothetical protein [Acidimicrobiia bacterium]